MNRSGRTWATAWTASLAAVTLLLAATINAAVMEAASAALPDSVLCAPGSATTAPSGPAPRNDARAHCGFCIAAADSPIEAITPSAQPSSATRPAAYRPPAAPSFKGPSALRSRARGPPVVSLA